MVSLWKLACIAWATAPVWSWPAARGTVPQVDSRSVSADSAEADHASTGSLQSRMIPDGKFYIANKNSRKLQLPESAGFPKDNKMTLGETISKGIFGSVYRIQSHQDLVIKISNTWDKNPGVQARLEKTATADAQILKEFSDAEFEFVPKYVASGFVHDDKKASIEPDTQALIMERVHGKSLKALQGGGLRDYLRENEGSMQPIILGMLQDLERIFKKAGKPEKGVDMEDYERTGKGGYYHGDIKPDNIMITQSEPRAMFVDFGAAGYGSVKERSNMALIYLSPEELQMYYHRQAKNSLLVPKPDKLPVTQESDLWAMKVVIMEMVSGKVWATGKFIPGKSLTATDVPWYMSTMFLMHDKDERAKKIREMIGKGASDKFVDFLAASFAKKPSERLTIQESIEKVEDMLEADFRV